jgi:hypothetical protein
MTEKEEIKLLKKYSHLVWGGIPLDIQWALKTQVWKTYKTKLNDIL